MNREPRLLWPSLWRLALAGAVFIIVYGFCNHFTSTRSDVGIIMWEWEHHIPFIPEMVIPYWSLDLFFIGAFFICSSKVELNLLTKRLLAVTLFSGACYLLFPLQMGLERPEPAGWTAPLFRALYHNDLPYNLAPSLHISLRSLLWVFFGAHLSGWARRIVKFWFILIGLSTLLVWQHHIIDVAAGFVMAWFVTALVRDPRQADTFTPSKKLALRYGSGALLCTGLAFLWIGFAWPALALVIFSLTYATGRISLLGKENGCLSPSSEWCLLPVLLVARIYQSKWLKTDPSSHEITPGVRYGRMLSNQEAAHLVDEDPLSVLDLTAESNSPSSFREQARYISLPLLDLVPPSQESIQAALAYIRAEREKNRNVYIHCQLGLQRSATIAAHWLVASDHSPDLPHAVASLRETKPGIMI